MVFLKVGTKWILFLDCWKKKITKHILDILQEKKKESAT